MAGSKFINWFAALLGGLEDFDTVDAQIREELLITHADGQINGLSEKSTPVNGDWVLIEDSADSNAKKKAQLGNLPGGGGAGSDTTAIHDDTASEISAIAEKVSPASGDLLIIEDSADSNNKKRVQIGNLPGGSDADAIHDNVSGEIAAVAEKVTPVSGDLILIEDSAASNAKKRVQVGNLPGGTDADAIHDNVSGEINGIAEKSTLASEDLFVIEDSAASNAKKKVIYGNIVPSGITPWFEWNGSDLTQFDSATTGSDVTASNATTVSFGGDTWVHLSVTYNTGGFNGNQQAMVLPITTTPPSADYRIECEVYTHNAIASGWCGSGTVVRYTGIGSYYSHYIVGQPGTRSQEVYKTTSSTGSATALIGSADTLANCPDVNMVNWGATSVSGDATNTFVGRMVTLPWLFNDNSTPISATGQAGITLQPAGSAGDTLECYFRHIRCFTVPRG